MSSLFKTTVVKGNRLTDFANTTATVGIPMPFGYGSYVVDGNVIWAALPPKEHVSRQRVGKGGTKQETYTYTLSYAICFGRGPISGFVWIKRNGKIVYTSDPGAPVEDQAYAAKWLEKATFYYGTTDQLPDSTIESYKGSGKVSAFRRDIYIVIEDDDVTDGAGAVPSYEACVTATGVGYSTTPPYPVEATDAHGTDTVAGDGFIWGMSLDEAATDTTFVGGGFWGALDTYTVPTEAHDTATTFVGGGFYGTLDTYTMAPEAYDTSTTFVGGGFWGDLLEYTHPAEGHTTSTDFVGGEFT